ncbi:hypothetical protein ACIQZG_20750 [Lysinibacillus sp. NPDC096418]|uniref:hypothetical protein n=1 Tax=Lysinibacillus sp. NPDC096418 TaxID=3364138 RepID=UPI00380E885F
MPIIKNNDNTLTVRFGLGDINIGSGLTNNETEGIVTFREQEPHPIGHFVKNEEKQVDLVDYPVHLVFQNVASLDVLIERLQTSRKYMTGELDVWED